MDFRQKGVGINDAKFVQVDGTHQANRVSLRPQDNGAYGSYRVAMASGVIAAGLTGALPIWEMRWGSSSVLHIPRALNVQLVVSTTAFSSTAVDASISLYRAQGFSALDTTNGSTLAFTVGKSGASATRTPASQFAGDATTLRTSQGGLVILNTSASGLTGGTKAQDTNPIQRVNLPLIASAAACTTILAPTYLIDPALTPAIAPLEIIQNEGLVLTADAITGTGTWRAVVTYIWDEVDPNKYFGNNS